MFLTAASLSGCAMPRSATSLHEVESASAAGQIQLVPVTAATVPPPGPALRGTFPAELAEHSDYAYERLGPGDRLAMRIYESGTPTVFVNGTRVGQANQVASYQEIADAVNAVSGAQ